MKLYNLLGFCAATSALMCPNASAGTSLPDPAAKVEQTVTRGNARFTILTPRLVRIEYNDSGKFEDRATFLAVNRNFPAVNYSVVDSAGHTVINTGALRLAYRDGADARKPENLNAAICTESGLKEWHPGAEEPFNLKGTYRTLDGNNGDSHRKFLENGPISRDGWAVIDDSPDARRGDGSRSLIFEKSVDGIPWIAPRPADGSMDVYLFGYGHDYKKAIGDYTVLAGKVPLPPRFAFGYWYSKYDGYTSDDFREIARALKENDINSDVIIFDMDWHYNGREESGGRGGWTGWTWNSNLIPDPDELIADMHSQGLRVALNLHPATGVAPDEDIFEAMRLELQPDSAKTRKIDWAIQDSTFYRSFFKHFIHKEEERGVDFWWLDWQQKLVNPMMDGMGETFWLNHVFFNDMLNNRDRRPMIFHRWGGLGSHRYQIGFSGDTYINYPTLEFQPYFTSTASNVCYGYWGHDLGGHMIPGDSDQDPNDPELVLRWVQYGVFTPIFRTHATRDDRIERRIWKYPNFPLLRESVKLRYALLPYIYTMARKCYDTGISLTRPLYYEYPELEEAYANETQYFFGDDILVAPIFKKGNGVVSEKTLWLPEGEWYSPSHSRMLEGGKDVTMEFTHNQFPWFIRKGAVIATNPPELKHASEQSDRLILNFYGLKPGEFELYEDSGDSKDYATEYATTLVSHSGDGKKWIYNVAPRKGGYKDMPTTKSCVVKIYDCPKPAVAKLNGKKVPATYDKKNSSAEIDIPAFDCTQGFSLAVEYK
ncbi:MAG: DUF5110 domain-containing protein [Muribaculaceae bacterium]|nr:DUF5110 domain-containing protein [Muribaculaceae bacterium]